MFEETIGKIALTIAFFMQMAGFIIIKKIVDIRV
jgi:Flp pilus assembly protein TadB